MGYRGQLPPGRSKFPAGFDFLHLNLIIPVGETRFEIAPMKLFKSDSIQFDTETRPVRNRDRSVFENESTGGDNFLVLPGIVSISDILYFHELATKGRRRPNVRSGTCAISKILSPSYDSVTIRPVR